MAIVTETARLLRHMQVMTDVELRADFSLLRAFAADEAARRQLNQAYRHRMATAKPRRRPRRHRSR
jgi:hypothetical protein